MRRKLQRFVGLIAAAALCAAIPAGAAAAEPNMLWDFGQEFDTSISEPMEITTFDTGDTGTSVVTTGADTTVENTGYYTVTIPATVSVSGTDASGKPGANFTLSGTVSPYRKLTIKLSSAHGDKLVCGTSTLGYTLSASTNDADLTISENSKTYSVNTNDTAISFSANLAVEVTDTPTVSGEYSDTLTFTMDCVKTSKTIHVFYEKENSYKCISSSFKDSTDEYPAYPHIGQYYPDKLTDYEEEHVDENIEVPPGTTKTYTIDNGDSKSNLWENDTCTVEVADGDGKTDYQVHFYRKMCQLDLNLAIWDATKKEYTTYNKSTDTVNTNDLLKTDIYINGKCVAEQRSDHYTGYPCGLTYEFRNINAQTGYKLVGYYIGNPPVGENVEPVHQSWAEGSEQTVKGELPGLNATKVNGDGTYGAVIMWLVLEKADDTGTTTTQTLPDDGTTMMDAMRVTMESQLSDLTDDVAEPTPETATDAPDSPALVDEYAVDDYPVVFFDTAG